MRKLVVVTFGIVIGVLLAWQTLVLFVEVPAECGEPAACGDDHLYPAIYAVAAWILGFPVVAWVIGKRFSVQRSLGLVTLLGVLVAVLLWLTH